MRRLLITTATYVLALFLPASICAQTGFERERAVELVLELYEHLELAPRDSYLNYAVATLARRFDIDLAAKGMVFPLVPLVTQQPAERVELLGLLTGARAVHESLQLTELLHPGSQRGEDASSGPITTPVDQLAAPSLPPHDYGALLEGRTLHVDDEAHLVPGDGVFLRFQSGRSLVACLARLEPFIDHVRVCYEEEPIDTDPIGATFRRLGLPDPRRYPDLFESIPGPVTIASSDLFFREGTDVTVILPRGMPRGLLGTEERPGVSRHIGEASGRLVISTSKRGLERVQRIDAQSPASLASQPDYLYLRSLAPPYPEETAFLFVSDACVRRLLGPKLRILESRRVRCASHLHTILNATLLYRRLGGEAPQSFGVLETEGLLPEAALRCPHRGEYRLDEDYAAACSVHGRLDRLTALLDLDLDEVSDEEARAYSRFVRGYEAMWRRYYDPIGVSVVQEADSWRARTIVLPIGEMSLYRNLESLTGRATGAETEIETPDTILVAKARLERGAVHRLASSLRSVLGLDGLELDTFHRGFEPRATLGLLDGSLAVDFDLGVFLGEAVRSARLEDVLLAPLLAGASLPAFVALEVSDLESAREFVTSFEKALRRRSGRSSAGAYGLDVDTYELASDRDGVACGVLKLKLYAFQVRLFFRLEPDALLIATTEEALRHLVETRRFVERDASSFSLTFHPARWQHVRPDLIIGWAEAGRRVCGRALEARRPFLRAGLEDIESLLGASARCPEGGRYVEDEGSHRCTIHGSLAAPVQAPIPGPKSAGHRLLDEVVSLRFDVGFLDDGLETTITLGVR